MSTDRPPREFYWRMSLARRLLASASARLGTSDPFDPSRAVMEAQDDVELMLAAIADFNGYTKDSANERTFLSLVGAVPAAKAHRDALRSLNELRVQAKHHGMEPHREEAARKVEAATRIASKVSTKEQPRLDVATAFLGAGIRNLCVKHEIDAAEHELTATPAHEEFLECVGRAMAYLRRHARTIMRRHDRGFRLPRPADRVKWDDHLVRVLETVETELAELRDERIDEVLVPDVGARIVLDSVVPRYRFAGDGTLRPQHARHLVGDELEGPRRISLLLTVVEAAHAIERLDQTAAITVGDGGWTNFRIKRSCSAIASVKSTDIEVAHLLPGEIFRAARGTDGEFVWLSVFGAEARVPAACVDELPEP